MLENGSDQLKQHCHGRHTRLLNELNSALNSPFEIEVYTFYFDDNYANSDFEIIENQWFKMINDSLYLRKEVSSISKEIISKLLTPLKQEAKRYYMEDEVPSIRPVLTDFLRRKLCDSLIEYDRDNDFVVTSKTFQDTYLNLSEPSTFYEGYYSVAVVIKNANRNNKTLIEDAVWEYYMEYNSLASTGYYTYEFTTDSVLNKVGITVFRNIMRKLKAEHAYEPLYQIIDRISALAYEKDEAVGSMVLMSDEDIQKIDDTDFIIKFDRQYQLHDSKLARKLLQLVSDGMFLLSSPYEIYGVIELEKCNLPDISMYRIDFLKGRVWEVKTGIIVFTNNIKNELSRLSNASIPIVPPISLSTSDNHIIKAVTSIDGAIMCDFEGVCYAIGMILDGLSDKDLKKEDIARGARHNSAYRYIESENGKGNCIVTIVSEDGDISTIPRIQDIS